jgi:hypothetical protein
MLVNIISTAGGIEHLQFVLGYSGIGPKQVPYSQKMAGNRNPEMNLCDFRPFFVSWRRGNAAKHSAELQEWTDECKNHDQKLFWGDTLRIIY